MAQHDPSRSWPERHVRALAGEIGERNVFRSAGRIDDEVPPYDREFALAA
jgi:hypothetical protein